jgi:hypothetical protein
MFELSSVAMSRILRTLLLWILIAALPLQGVAAIARAPCLTQTPMQAATAIAHGEHHAHHDMQMNRAQHDAPIDIHKMKNHGGSCASCCGGIAALPGLSIDGSAVSGSEPAVAIASFFPDTAFLSGLERPPKHSLF